MSVDPVDAMWAECLADGQSARRVDAASVPALREGLRRAARAAGVRVRTAVLADHVVIVARTDAAIWLDDTATMRRKLTPPS